MRELFYIPDRGTENLFFGTAILMGCLLAWGMIKLAPWNGADKLVFVGMGLATLGVFSRAVLTRKDRLKRLDEVNALRESVARSTNG